MVSNQPSRTMRLPAEPDPGDRAVTLIDGQDQPGQFGDRVGRPGPPALVEQCAGR